MKNAPDISGIKHIAIIMDGNGRWAKKRLMPREYGHSYGAKNFKKIVRYCGEIGIENITVYAFSTENWKRPKKEVDSIMKIMKSFISMRISGLTSSGAESLFRRNFAPIWNISSASRQRENAGSA
mgnify:CR=1 FL=1